MLGLQEFVFFPNVAARLRVEFLFLELTTSEEAIQSPSQVKNISYICLMMAVDLRFPAEVKHLSRTSGGQSADPGLRNSWCNMYVCMYACLYVCMYMYVYVGRHI